MEFYPFQDYTGVPKESSILLAQDQGRYADLCFVQKLIDSAVVHFKNARALYWDDDYQKTVFGRQRNYLRALDRDEPEWGYLGRPEMMDENVMRIFLSSTPFFFSRSAQDPLFAVVAAYPGMTEADFGISPAYANQVFFFILTADPSNLCMVYPDRHGAPFAMCGFDLSAPPVVSINTDPDIVGAKYPRFPNSPYPPSQYNLPETVIAPSFAEAAARPGIHMARPFAAARDLLLLSYPHYFLAQQKPTLEEKVKFIREHTAVNYQRTYLGALLAAQRIYNNALGTAKRDQLRQVPPEFALRVVDPQASLYRVPYQEGLMQNVVVDETTPFFAGTNAMRLKRWFGADYAVFYGSNIGKSRFGQAEKYVLMDYRYRALYHLEPTPGYTCTVIAESSVHPLLARPTIVADFTPWQRPIIRIENEPRPAVRKWETSARKSEDRILADVNIIMQNRQIERLYYYQNLSYQLPFSASAPLAVLRSYSATLESSFASVLSHTLQVQSRPSAFPFDPQQKIGECREALQKRGSAKALVEGLLKDSSKVLAFERPNRGSIVSVVFTGTKEDWLAAMRDAKGVTKDLTGSISLPDGTPVTLIGASEIDLFDRSGGASKGIVVYLNAPIRAKS
ncbi:MAG: hypothetical protein RMM31_11380 [Anaerolineae bacterium]|nr:hypothetical protein [Thermoflexales bacterium]MDW8396831.1 hypothetical protein [Anaerolineae bacterium]